MADFYFEKYVHDYEIDFYNHGTTEEVAFFIKNNIEIGCYCRDGGEWCKRLSGMVFNIKDLRCYPILKKYLNDRFNVFIRKEKLKKLNEIKL
jgi:hypothetical protein